MAPEDLRDVLRAEADSVSARPTVCSDAVIGGRHRIARRRRGAAVLMAASVAVLVGAVMLTGSSEPAADVLATPSTTTPASAWDGTYRPADRAAFDALFGGGGGGASEVEGYESLREARAAADLVVVGRLTDVVSTRPVAELTYTAVRLQVDEVLAGSTTPTSVLFELGGPVSTVDLPHGEAVWFLREKAGKEDYHRLVSSQGLFVPGPRHVESPAYAHPAPGIGAPAGEVPPVTDPLAVEASRYASLEQLAASLRPSPRTGLSQLRTYGSLSDLAADSTSVVIAERVNTPVSLAPLPGSPDSAPTPYVTVRVTRLLNGAGLPADVRVVSPGSEQSSGEAALSQGGPFLLFLQPAVYGANQPAGGYVITGGTAGLYASANGLGEPFLHSDADMTPLPQSVTQAEAAALVAGRTEADVIRQGR